MFLRIKNMIKRFFFKWTFIEVTKQIKLAWGLNVFPPTSCFPSAGFPAPESRKAFNPGHLLQKCDDETIDTA